MNLITISFTVNYRTDKIYNETVILLEYYSLLLLPNLVGDLVLIIIIIIMLLV